MEVTILILTGILGSLTTYVLHNYLGQSDVRASALPSLIVALFFFIFPEITSSFLQNKIPILFIGASFVGMVSNKVLHHWLYIILAGAIFSIIYINLGSFFKGFGGSLGNVACISVITTLGLATLKKHKGIKKRKK